MWLGGHSFLCCGLLTFLFVLYVMGTELMEQGACSRLLWVFCFFGFFLISLGLNSGPRCIGINMGKFCYFSDPTPCLPQWKQQQKQALRCFLEHSSCPQQLFIAVYFPSPWELCYLRGLKPHQPSWLQKVHKLLVSYGSWSTELLWCPTSLQRALGWLGFFSRESARRKARARQDGGSLWLMWGAEPGSWWLEAGNLRCEPARWIWLRHRLAFFADRHSAVMVDLLVQTSTTGCIRFPVCVTSPRLVPDADECVSYPNAFSAVLVFYVLQLFSCSDPPQRTS